MAKQTWFDKHPEDAKKFIKEAQALRKTRLNKFASNKKKNWRMLGTIPIDLYYHIHKTDPTVFENKTKARRFFRELDAFRIPEKI